MALIGKKIQKEFFTVILNFNKYFISNTYIHTCTAAPPKASSNSTAFNADVPLSSVVDFAP